MSEYPLSKQEIDRVLWDAVWKAAGQANVAPITINQFDSLSDLDLVKMLHAVKSAGSPEDKPFTDAILVELGRRQNDQSSNSCQII